jgi:uncharacterized membrane protein YphA (DoxX/SURF4 family)
VDRARLSREPRIAPAELITGLLRSLRGYARRRCGGTVRELAYAGDHAPYALFNLNPGLQGLLELVGGLLLALGLFTRTVAFILR